MAARTARGVPRHATTTSGPITNNAHPRTRRAEMRRDGGNVELVDVKDGVVKVKLVGHCAGCPMSQMTLKMGIEKYLKKEVPEVKESVPAPAAPRGVRLNVRLPLAAAAEAP